MKLKAALLTLISVGAFAAHAATEPSASSSNTLNTGTTKMMTVGKIKKAKKKKTEDEAGGFSGSLIVAERMPIEAKVGNATQIILGLNYGFYKTYSLGVGGNYVKPYGEPNPYYDGFDDVYVSLSDGKLIDMSDRGFTMSASLGYQIPVSKGSQDASLHDGWTLGGTASQVWTKWFTLSHETSVGRYFHQYDTAESSPEKFNTAYSLNNELTAKFTLSETVSYSILTGMSAALDYAGKQARKYVVSTGISWKAFSQASFRFGAKSVRAEGGERNIGDAATTNFSLSSTISF